MPLTGRLTERVVMVINTNISAQTAAGLLQQSSSMLSASLARLSSGSKITNPADDSAGLAVSMNLVAQEGRNTAASNNIANAVSFNQTQDGYLAQVTSALDRMSELAIQSQDITKSDSDRALYNKEFTTLASYVNDVSTKDFNGVSLFTGTSNNVTIDSDGGGFTMTGINLTGTTFTTATLGTVDTLGHAASALTAVKNAITTVATDRATLGANEETLTDFSGQLATLNNNLAAANSQIMDVDVATESTQYAKENILVQTGTAMLAQANSLPQIALKLLQ
jgi:flagellin